jgi:hypothetical protein
MDTFFNEWGDFQGSRQYATMLAKDDSEIAHRMAVLIRRSGVTKQICEYWFEDFEQRKREGVSRAAELERQPSKQPVSTR